MQVQYLGQKNPLKESMETHSGILGLENPMDKSAWWALIHRVEKSWTRLK